MEWAQESLGRCEVGDERRTRRRVTGETGPLFVALEGAPLRGTQGVQMAQRGGAHGRRARQATAALRPGAGGVGQLTVNVGLAVARHPPAGRRFSHGLEVWGRSAPADNLERMAVMLAFVGVRLLQLREWLASTPG